MTGGPQGSSKKLFKLLEEKKVRIPPYQRKYDWDKKTITQLLECLRDHVDDNGTNIQSDPYFLGNLMVHADDEQNTWNLVDGQQRLAKLTQKAASVRDINIENA